ncbi:hypothetical protein DFH06DRAFT_1159877 [Mycena polygramma]|nr:hypothetical protein DFH06DRAFT_1159877 [Mycena polygramma]
MVSYHTVREQFRLFFKPTAVGGATYNSYRWCGIHGQINPSRQKSHDPPFTNDPANQTTFLHGWSISLLTGIWGSLVGEVQTLSIVDFQSLLNTPDGSSAAGPIGSLFSWAFNYSATRGATGGQRHIGEQAVVLSDLTPSTAFNPAKLINQYILYKVSSLVNFDPGEDLTQITQTPQGTGVVMSHDDDWCAVLGDVRIRIPFALFTSTDGAILI